MDMRALCQQSSLLMAQGHIAYPMNADNPIHSSSSAINELINQKYDLKMNTSHQPHFKFLISIVVLGLGILYRES